MISLKKTLTLVSPRTQEIKHLLIKSKEIRTNFQNMKFEKSDFDSNYLPSKLKRSLTAKNEGLLCQTKNLLYRDLTNQIDNLGLFSESDSDNEFFDIIKINEQPASKVPINFRRIEQSKENKF